MKRDITSVWIIEYKPVIGLNWHIYGDRFYLTLYKAKMEMAHVQTSPRPQLPNQWREYRVTRYERRCEDAESARKKVKGKS